MATAWVLDFTHVLQQEPKIIRCGPTMNLTLEYMNSAMKLAHPTLEIPEQGFSIINNQVFITKLIARQVRNFFYI